MGMDVYGVSPTSTTGEYFRRSIWGWHPLASLIETLAPSIARPCEHWHSNDGDGLDAEHAGQLAAALTSLVEDGSVAAYIAQRDAELAQLPNESCSICDGTGIRTDDVGVADAMSSRKIADVAHPRCGETGWCNGCDGRGWNRAWATHYRLDQQDVIEFIAFLKGCGGFEIC